MASIKYTKYTNNINNSNYKKHNKSNQSNQSTINDYKSIIKNKTFMHKTKYPSYLFNFDNRLIEYHNGENLIEFNNTLFYKLETTLKNIIKENPDVENYYIICPVYVSKTTKQILDTQLTVTGKCHKNENEFETTIREIQEELGITTINGSNNILFNNTLKYGNKTESSFVIDISESKHFDPKQDMVVRGKDDNYKKIRVIVCGNIEKILEMYKNIYNRPESNDIETIKFVRIISLKEFI